MDEVRYYLNLDEDGYLLSISTVGEGISIASLDGLDLSGERINAYRWDGEKLTFDEERWASVSGHAEEPETPTQADRIEAQVYYTAMMTDTLLEV